MAQVFVPFVISMGLSFLAGFIAEQTRKKGRRASLQDDKPTTIASRGAFIAYLLGVRRLGPIFAWVGDKTSGRERTSSWSGKGGGSETKTKKATVYFESGWHHLCVGPATAIHAIYENGRDILGYSIDSTSHPSGTTVDLGKYGKFDIYWGETDQPVNTWLGNATRVGIESRWPFGCYIQWTKKRLGTVSQWPLLDYVVEVRPGYAVNVTADSAWIDPTFTLGSYSESCDKATSGAEGTGRFRVKGRKATKFNAGDRIKVQGNHANNDGDYVIKSITVTTVGYKTTKTNIYVYGGVTTDVASPAGTITLYESDKNGGANPAYVIDQLLFATHPHGLGLDVSNYDISTLDAIATALGTSGERLPVSSLAVDGEDAQSLLAELLQDIGIAMRWNVTTALWEFHLIREETARPQVPAKLLLPPLPEVTTVLDQQRPVDKLIFTFPSWLERFKEYTLVVDDDALAETRGRPRPRTIHLPTIIDIETATMVASRRAQEALGVVTAWRLVVQGEACLLRPGDSIDVEGITDPLRVMSITHQQDSGAVEIEAITDYYSVPATEEDAPASFTPATDIEEEILPDEEWEPIEVPPGITPVTPRYGIPVLRPLVFIPIIRGSAATVGHEVYISTDDSTFTSLGDDEGVYSGGLLEEDFPLSGATLVETGPEFTAEGDDIASVAQDLSADTEGWRAGKQMVFIGSEILFVREITAVSGDTYRLDGVLRGRLGTAEEEHSIDDPVFIVPYEDLTVYGDLLMRPGETYYFKVVPWGNQSIPLDELPSKSITLVGNGIVPPAVVNLRNDLMNSYFAGTDSPTFEWTYRFGRDPGSGSGNQASGEACAASAVEGEFLIDVLDASDVVKRSLTVTEPTWQYTNANMLADFGGAAPSSFKISVVHAVGGRASAATVLTMTKH